MPLIVINRAFYKQVTFILQNGSFTKIQISENDMINIFTFLVVMIINNVLFTFYIIFTSFFKCKLFL